MSAATMFAEPDDNPSTAAEPDGHGPSSTGLGFGLDFAIPTAFPIELVRVPTVATAGALPRCVAAPVSVLHVAPKTSPPVRF